MPMMKCHECGDDYLGNRNGKYCSVKCAAKNRPSQYQKMKARLDGLKDLPDEIDYLLLIVSDVDHALSGAYELSEWAAPRVNLKALTGRLTKLRAKCT